MCVGRYVSPHMLALSVFYEIPCLEVLKFLHFSLYGFMCLHNILRAIRIFVSLYNHICKYSIKSLSEIKLINCALEIYIIRFQEKNFEPEPGFEPWTSRSLAWCSTN